MNFDNRFPSELALAREESDKSDMHEKVGAVVVVGKSKIRGHNKKKTHTKYANPNKHKRVSIHAELDCLLKIVNDQFPNLYSTNGTIYVYRKTADGNPAMARPCEHCMEFLKKSDIHTIVYSIAESPFYREERI